MNHRAKIGKELVAAKSAYDSLTYDTICHKFGKQPIFTSPELRSLNSQLDDINVLIDELWMKFETIKRDITSRLDRLTHEYFVQCVPNVKEFKNGEVEFHINGFPRVVQAYHLSYLRSDMKSGMISLTVDRCTETYDFKFVDGEIRIEKNTCLY